MHPLPSPLPDYRERESVGRVYCVILVLILALPSISLRADDSKPTEAVLHKFSPVDTVIDKAVHDATVTRQQDPIKFLVQDMGSITGDLSAYHTDKPVQAKEEKVVGQLDEMIKQLEQETKGGAGGNMNPMRPMADSKLGGGPGGIHEPDRSQGKRKTMGQSFPQAARSDSPVQDRRLSAGIRSAAAKLLQAAGGRAGER